MKEVRERGRPGLPAQAPSDQDTPEALLARFTDADGYDTLTREFLGI
jgi:hypothetical protein